MATDIKNLLVDKNVLEKSIIKSQEIVKLNCIGKYKIDKLDIEILGLNAINVNNQDGIEVLVKANNGKPIGFGKDGSVEIERFRIFNPPILVDDIYGDIEVPYTDIEGNKKVRKLREDPLQALLNTLTHTIQLVGKDDKNIIDGKVGNTTSTFYSVAGANSPVDGYSMRTSQATYTLARDTADGTGSVTNDTVNYAAAENSGSAYGVYRLFNCFDTSTIGTDAIDSAVVSLYFAAGTGSQGVGLTQASLASTANVATGDFDACTVNSPDEGATRIGYPSAGYNSFTLNATGKGWIQKTGVTQFCFRDEKDIDNSTPPSSPRQYKGFYGADETGTDKDPKLVVEHSEATGGAVKHNFLTLGVS